MRNPVEIGQATVFDATIAKQNPFLYAVYGVSETGVALYIGQTRGRTGALGRLSQHLSDTPWNTYLQRLSELYRHEKILLEKVDLVAIRFAQAKIFETKSADYREAVEDLVQCRLIDWVIEHKLAIGVVSRTRPNSYSRLQEIQEEANRIFAALESWILERYQEGM